MSVYWGQHEETVELVQYCNGRIVNRERDFFLRQNYIVREVSSILAG